MQTADLYIRVSTDEQAVKGYSQRSQQDRLVNYCTLHKIEILRIIVEDYSAKTFNRPAWIKASVEWNRYKEKRPDFLLFTIWNRFSRNVGDAYYMISKLKQLGIEPKAIEQPLNLTIPENKMMLALYLASSEVENDRRALNIKQGLREARQEGRWPGPAPMGYLNVTSPTGQKYIILHEPEATAIRQVFKLLSVAKHSISYVHRYAASIGLTCSISHFQKLIQNPFYCGKIKVAAWDKEKGYLVKGLHEKLISEHLFNQVQVILNSKRKIITSLSSLKSELPLRGFLLCPLCGKTLTGSASQGHLKKYFYYHCSKGCHFRVRADSANNHFSNMLKTLKPLAAYSSMFTLAVHETYQELYENKIMDQAHTIKAMEQLIDRVVKAREALYSGAIDSDDFAAIKEDCEKRINVLGLQLQQLANMELSKSDNLEKVSRAIMDIAGLYEHANLNVKRQIVSLAFNQRATYKEPMEQMLCSAFKAVFNLKCEIADDKKTSDYGIAPNEIESSSQWKQVLTTRLAEIKEYNPILVRQIARILIELATIGLVQNQPQI